MTIYVGWITSILPWEITAYESRQPVCGLPTYGDEITCTIPDTELFLD